MMPKLLYDRLDELGLDFVVVYPTAGLRFPRISDDATRRAVIRAYNIVSADYFSGLGDRLTAGGESSRCTRPTKRSPSWNSLRSNWARRSAMFGSNMARKVPAAAANDPDTARFAVWYDVLRHGKRRVMPPRKRALASHARPRRKADVACSRNCSATGGKPCELALWIGRWPTSRIWPRPVVVVNRFDAEHVVPNGKPRGIRVVWPRPPAPAGHVAAEHADLRAQLLRNEFQLGDRFVGRCASG